MTGPDLQACIIFLSAKKICLLYLDFSLTSLLVTLPMQRLDPALSIFILFCFFLLFFGVIFNE
jgi:hypothetical protein